MNRLGVAELCSRQGTARTAQPVAHGRQESGLRTHATVDLQAPRAPLELDEVGEAVTVEVPDLGEARTRALDPADSIVGTDRPGVNAHWDVVGAGEVSSRIA